MVGYTRPPAIGLPGMAQGVRNVKLLNRPDLITAFSQPFQSPSQYLTEGRSCKEKHAGRGWPRGLIFGVGKLIREERRFKSERVRFRIGFPFKIVGPRPPSNEANPVSRIQEACTRPSKGTRGSWSSRFLCLQCYECFQRPRLQDLIFGLQV